ncbi:MAG: helicase HerA domain-containing protein [Candidatus Aminicenantia bacterium]
MSEKMNLYIGKEIDIKSGALKYKYFYRIKDLTTHAVIIGMTGSGKTGMALVLLEEAILNGIPVIAVDPKGDLPNLLLAFSGLSSEEFKPWIAPQLAEQKGLSLDIYAENIANTWRNGLKEWEILKERISQFKNSADFTIFTPGSTSGVPVSALKGFKKPSGVLDDEETKEKIKGITTALLGLIGIQTDPVKSREHILISAILQEAWQKGDDLTIEDLILQVQNPPFEKLGVFSVDSFYPKQERMNLSMQLNALIASPSFQTWLRGEPLIIDNFIRKNGKPRVSIFYIAHLSDLERMFFVTLLLQELLSWMRAQPGSDIPRVIFYFDEVFGYFPPHPSNPPSKYPILTLMKQARAFGLSVVLATQNPVDLDYKGLTNAGTWFIGKLQQERDKERVLTGLEGTLQESGKSLDKSYFESIINSLKPRNFLLHNVHTNEAKLITSRWAMCYLRGPLTKSQISSLMSEKRSEVKGEEFKLKSEVKKFLPDFPEGIPVLFEKNRGLGPFVPYLYAETEALYKQESANIFVEKTFRAFINSNLESIIFENIDFADSAPLVDTKPPEGSTFAEVPEKLLNKNYYKKIQEQLKQIIKSKEELYYYNPYLKLYSSLGEKREEFIERIKERLKSILQSELRKIREKFEKEKLILENKLRNAQNLKERAEAELKVLTTETAMDIGSSIISILTGRGFKGSLRRAGSNAITRRQRATLKKQQAEMQVQKIMNEISELENNMELALKEKEAEILSRAEQIEEKLLRPVPSSVVIKYISVVFR